MFAVTQNIISLVSKLGSRVISKGLNHRQFKDFLRDMESEYGVFSTKRTSCSWSYSDAKIHTCHKLRNWIVSENDSEKVFFSFLITTLCRTSHFTLMSLNRWMNITYKEQSFCKWNVCRNSSVWVEASIVRIGATIKQHDTFSNSENRKAHTQMLRNAHRNLVPWTIIHLLYSRYAQILGSNELQFIVI